MRTVADIADMPDGAADLVFVCTPASANIDLLKACAAKGIRAAFLTSAGYGEAGEEGSAPRTTSWPSPTSSASCWPGPNGQGVVSTPASLCAQIVAPYPPAGRIGVASQSGNFVSSFLNYARATGVGISRAVSAGNASAVTVADYLDFYADDPATGVGLAYVEGIVDGRGLLDQLSGAAARKPLVLVKGGATAGGAKAAASHTGALGRERQGVRRRVPRSRHHPCRHGRGGVRGGSHVRHPTAAAGPRVVVLTTAGGWGVVTSDAITRDRDLELIDLPADLKAAIDAAPAAAVEP